MSNRGICSFLDCGAPVQSKGLCQGHYRQRWLGKPLAPLVPRWTDDDLEYMRRHYEAGLPGGVEAIAKKLGRDAGNVSRKAGHLGLTSKNRQRPIARVPQAALDFHTLRNLSTEEKHVAMSDVRKRILKQLGHPRGMLGKKHTPETIAVVSAASRAKWQDPNSKLNSEESRQRRSDAMIASVVAGRMRSGGYSRGKGGRRDDLGGQYFRSRWEANYARFLNLCIKQGSVVRWEFEPQVFVFEAIKRGTRAYTPDFKVHLPNGSHEWHEVKGWMDDKSATRLKRMAKYYPTEQIKVIGPSFFATCRKTGLAAAIPNWEVG